MAELEIIMLKKKKKKKHDSEKQILHIFSHLQNLNLYVCSTYFYVFVYMCSYMWDTKVKWGAMREKEDACKTHNGICVI